ncbi:ATP-binding protein [Bacillus smithii]|uniref:ATP-binding protein n=1 Tax=Bacillus smithii TaxID=1479 RepID=UPI0030C9BB0E
MVNKKNISFIVNKFQSLIKDSRHLIMCISSSGRLTYVSPASALILGYEAYELLGTLIYSYIHPEDRYKLEHSDHGWDKVEYRARRKCGDYVWLETSCIAMTNEMEYFCISHDVSERKVFEEQIQEEKEKYRLLLENTVDTIGIVTDEGFFVDINQAGKQLLGSARKEEIIGRSLFDYLLEEYIPLVKTYLQHPHQEDSLEVCIRRVDQIVKCVEFKLIPLFYKNRHTYQIILKDITNKKETEKMLQKAEKLTIVGQLAAGIAHEIRNPLTAIKGFTQLLSNMGHRDYTDVILTELDRIDKIVSDLLVLAKPQISHLEEINLVELIDRVVTLLRTQAIMYNIDIISDIRLKDCPVIEAEADQIKQVLINLIKNAIEAMPEGGTVTIEAEVDHSEDHVVIRVIDEGIGIPRELISRLGEPFFSTKEKGTGLGLMICQRIIKNHKGSLEIDSEVNKGTTFTIRLPRKISKKNDRQKIKPDGTI